MEPEAVVVPVDEALDAPAQVGQIQVRRGLRNLSTRFLGTCPLIVQVCLSSVSEMRGSPECLADYRKERKASSELVHNIKNN